MYETKEVKKKKKDGKKALMYTQNNKNKLWIRLFFLKKYSGKPFIKIKKKKNKDFNFTYREDINQNIQTRMEQRISENLGEDHFDFRRNRWTRKAILN